MPLHFTAKDSADIDITTLTFTVKTDKAGQIYYECYACSCPTIYGIGSSASAAFDDFLDSVGNSLKDALEE